MKDLKLKLEKSVNEISFKESWEIYENSLPEDERRNLKQQKKLLRNIKYKFYSVELGKEIIGLLGIWKLKNYIFIEHFAIREDLRNKGLGSKIIKKFLENIKKIVILEVERPQMNAMAKRRIGFWERCGFNLNNHNYIQPPYSPDKSPLPLFIMSYPKKINEKDFNAIRNEIHLNVYGMKEPILKTKGLPNSKDI